MMTEKTYYNNISSSSIHVSNKPLDWEMEAFFCPHKVGFLETKVPFSIQAEYETGYIILLTVSGAGILEFDDRKFLVGEKQLCYINCDKKYKITSAKQKNDRWHFLYLYFDGSTAKNYYDIIMCNREPVCTISNNKAIESMIWRIINLYRDKTAQNKGIIASMYITRMLTDISVVIVDESKPSIYCPAYINEIYFYIDYNYMKKITLESIGKHLSMNKYYIAHQFKKFSGMTINQYVTSKRINQAKFLLSYTEKSIESISDEIGFYNSGHFIIKFKNFEQITPKQYRKAISQTIEK